MADSGGGLGYRLASSLCGQMHTFWLSIDLYKGVSVGGPSAYDVPKRMSYILPKSKTLQSV